MKNVFSGCFSLYYISSKDVDSKKIVALEVGMKGQVRVIKPTKTWEDNVFVCVGAK